ncbi:MAG: nitrophenyl compound nitroreductase subunit ArsF family protein [Bacteroidia bacterium]|nr:nitrophenyl compound nitroreductase subunit ArsF family protein [Bacteroidia bacterium]
MNTAILSLLLCFIMLSPDTVAQTVQKSAEKAEVKAVQILYFHGARRCSTCKAIEKVAKNTVKDRYAGDARVVFRTLNHEDKKNAALVEKYQIAGSSLIIQGTGKAFKDLTSECFQYARNDPGKLQSLVISTVDGYLK